MHLLLIFELSEFGISEAKPKEICLEKHKMLFHWVFFLNSVQFISSLL